MQFLPPQKMVWSRAKRYSPIVFAGILIRELLQHRFFAWVNDELDWRAGPMIHYIYKWLFNNPIMFYVILAVTYCLIVIIGSQLASSRAKRIISEIKELKSELDTLDWLVGSHLDVGNAVSQLNEWKDKTRRILTTLGQVELDNFAVKINYTKEKDKYSNSVYGRIRAFHNEANIYLKYLSDLLDSLEKHPELWR